MEMMHLPILHFFLITAAFAFKGNAFVLKSDNGREGGFAANQGRNVIQNNVYRGAKNNRKRTMNLTLGTAETENIASKENESISIESYQHKDWKCTYLYKPPSTGYEAAPPLLLIHPVGIGISSWFWKRFMEEFREDSPAIYAIDLIGCGLEHGADKWDPIKKGLFFPLSWAEGCETLIENVILPRFYDARRKSSGGLMTNISDLFQGSMSNAPNKCIVVTQGGIAPVGLLLASRNPDTIQKLVLCSPPIWDDIVTPVPPNELQRNYNFLRSPLFGPIAFGVLESRKAVQFFSDLFLFETKCDEEWLDCVEEATLKDARPPVEAFNAGLCMSRSLEEEAQGLVQPTLVLSGNTDKRERERGGFGKEMRNCMLEIVNGCNVLPWESPVELKNIIQMFSKN